MSSTQEAGDLFARGSGPSHAMLRSPTVLIASVGLWGMNVYFFRVFGIDYVKVLKYDLLKRLDGVDDTISKKDTEPLQGSQSDFGSADTDDDDDDYNVEEEFIMEGSNDLGAAITWHKLVSLSLLLLCMLHLTYFIWMHVLGGGPVGAVFCFYAVVTVGIVIPLPQLQWLRNATVIVCQRSLELFNPRCTCWTAERPIPFVDVFFADVLCSLSKVFFDWGILVHMAFHSGTLAPSTRSILLPSALAAVPYLVRSRQCLVMYNVGRVALHPHRFSHLWNALKYSTSIFPLLLSAYSKTVGAAAREEELETYLVLLLAINALYALYWDIVMDWGMMQNPTAVVVCSKKDDNRLSTLDQQQQRASCWRAFLRNRLRFGVAMSALILFGDAMLRFIWVLRFYKNLFPSEDSFVLCTQFLEVFRRAIWILLRVEWENLKQLGPVTRANYHHAPSGERYLTKMTQTSSSSINKLTLAGSKASGNKVATA
jgi:hypothetical protein